MNLDAAYFRKDLVGLQGLHLPEDAFLALREHWAGNFSKSLQHHQKAAATPFARNSEQALFLADRLLVEVKMGLGVAKTLSANDTALLRKYPSSRYVEAYGRVCHFFWVDHVQAWKALKKMFFISPLVPSRGACILSLFLFGHLWAVAGRSRLGYLVASLAFQIAWFLEPSRLPLAAFFKSGIYACYPYTLLVSGHLKGINKKVADLENITRDPFYDAIFLVSALYCYSYSADIIKTDKFVSRFKALHGKGEFLRYAPVSKIAGLLPIALRGYGHLIKENLQRIVREHDPKASDPLINSQFYRAAATVALLACEDRELAFFCLNQAETHRLKCKSFLAWKDYDHELQRHALRKGKINPWDLKFLHIPIVTNITQLGDMGLRLMAIIPEVLEHGAAWFENQAALIVAEHFNLGSPKLILEGEADLTVGDSHFTFSSFASVGGLEMRSVLTEVSLAVGNVRNTVARILEMQHKLDQANKNEAMAKAAQMVAHDIRKPFSLLRMGLSELRNLPSNTVAVERLDRRVSQAMSDAEAMLGEVLASGRDAQPMMTAIDASLLARQAVEDVLTCRHFEADRIKVDYLQDGFVYGSEARLKRLIVNLLENAFDAAGDAPVWLNMVAEHHQLIMTIGNRGRTIPDELLSKKIFEPYFTMGKENGTGLGLSIVKDIVEEFTGTISVASDREEGTRFTVRLPLMTKTARLDLKQVAVVDDDLIVLDAWRHALGESNVLTFDSPSGFWKQIKETPELLMTLDVVVTDQYFDNVSPQDSQPDGISFAHILKERRFDLPVILSSNAYIAVTATVNKPIDAAIEKRALNLSELNGVICGIQASKRRTVDAVHREAMTGI